MTPRHDGGQVTVFAVALLLMLFVMVGLVLDGGRHFTALRAAQNLAAAAARAGAQAVSERTLRDPNGEPGLDASAARQMAEEFLAAEGVEGTVDVGSASVTVTVELGVDPLILGLAGVGSRRVTATETAQVEGGP